MIRCNNIEFIWLLIEDPSWDESENWKCTRTMLQWFQCEGRSKSVVANRIKALRRKWLCTNCYSHALNICIMNVCNKIPFLQNTMNVAMKIFKLVKKWPWRESNLKMLRIEKEKKKRVFILSASLVRECKDHIWINL